jgi:hypothetical protein
LLIFAYFFDRFANTVADFSGRPLLDTRRDRRLFVDREPELSRLQRNVDERLNTLVLGERGVGKTSILYQLAGQLRNREDHGASSPVPVVVGGRAPNAGEFLGLVLASLAREREQVAGPEASTSMMESPLVDFTMRSRFNGLIWPTQREHTSGLDNSVSLLPLLQVLGSAIASFERDVVILVDELESAEVAHAVFGRMRDELWALGATWVVAGNIADRATYLEPPADAFFDQTMIVGPLDDQAAIDLVRRRGGDDRPGIGLGTVVSLAGGNPRALLTLAQQVFMGHVTAEELEERVSRTQDATAGLSGPALRLVQELEARGAGRATDQDLQERLGFSASRLRQLFAELEKAGVVEPSRERPDGPGRPPKVYVLSHAFGAAR